MQLYDIIQQGVEALGSTAQVRAAFTYEHFVNDPTTKQWVPVGGGTVQYPAVAVEVQRERLSKNLEQSTSLVVVQYRDTQVESGSDVPEIHERARNFLLSLIDWIEENSEAFLFADPSLISFAFAGPDRLAGWTLTAEWTVPEPLKCC